MGSPTWKDPFDAPVLRPEWTWINENPDRWSLTEQKGSLRIYTSPYGAGGENLLLQLAPSQDFTIETRLLFEPTSNFQIAGLVIYEDSENFLQLGRAYCDPGIPVCVGNGIYFDDVSNGVWFPDNFATPTASPSMIYLRLVRQQSIVTAYISENGTDWRMIGAHSMPEDFVINGVGLTASQNFSYPDVPPIPADFDYFHLSWSSPSVIPNRRDPFNAPVLGPQWRLINENPSTWSLTEQKGSLRIYTSPYAAGGENLVVQSAPSQDFVIETRLLFEPTSNFQIAGLVIYQDTNNFLQLGRAYCDPGIPVCIGNGIYFDNVSDGVWFPDNFATPTASPSMIYLRLARQLNTVDAYISEDGSVWVKIGSHTLPEDFVITGIGLTASQNFSFPDIPAIPADFDYFTLVSEQLKSY
ncbi:beta-xylosidase family glycoside hydrolase [Longilinea arvoryzae]|nr:DUF1349 domain-containing protein [Longilinea arvoryzae]